VSGREHEGTDGYWVVTPLTSGEPDAPALPLVRGWVSEIDSAPAPPAGVAEVVAWLQPTEGSGESDDDPADDVLPQMRTADLIQHVDQDLYGAYGVVDADAVGTNAGTAGLEPADLEQLPDAGRFTAIRNLLYALEWWVFGAFALFIWWRYVRDVTTAREPEPVPDDHPVPSEP
jgi:cytochrome oxidase assembly protein ShyY1